MREAKPRLTSELEAHCAGAPIWKARAFHVDTFRALVEHVARLAYANPDALLFFRGQDKDYQSKAGGTTLYPSIYRGDALASRELRHRFNVLDQAARLLVARFKATEIAGHKELRQKRFIQWSVLQHYEVVSTPLIDLTQSLRVACSFAQMEDTDSRCYVYVFGLPYLTNRISINSEHDVVNVRLLSICPPSALRPYFQEGYLAGTADITTDFDSKTELDFRNRLIAKFSIARAKSFWDSGFDRIPKNALYPDGDSVFDLCKGVRDDLSTELQPGLVGEFMQEWMKMEEHVLDDARHATERNVSIREAIALLAKRGDLDHEKAYALDSMRKLRNALVHQSKSVKLPEVEGSLAEVRRLLHEVQRR